MENQYQSKLSSNIYQSTHSSIHYTDQTISIISSEIQTSTYLTPQDTYKINYNNHKLTYIHSKIQQLSQYIVQTQDLISIFNIVNQTRKSIFQKLKQISEYFIFLHSQINKNIINTTISQTIINGTYNYFIQSSQFQTLTLLHKAIFILQFQTKFTVCLRFFQTIKQFASNITTQSKQKHSKVWQHIKFINFECKTVLKQKYQNIKKLFYVTTSAILSQQLTQSQIGKKILFGLSYPRYIVDCDSARLKSLLFYKKPNIKIAQSIWNIPQYGISKQFMKLNYQNIAFNQKIYIPIDQSNEEFPNIFQPGQNKIQIRILNHQKLFFKQKSQEGFKSFKNILFQNKPTQIKVLNTIIIHIHGGGFIALSSRMSQLYTRKWANQLKIPILSIDYRQPPNYPFPTPSNDCFTAYKFIITKIKHYINIDPINIFLTGQSAGGNLTCSLMSNILIAKLPSPKGIFLAYPSLDLRVKFSPSKINAISEPLLWPSILLLCLNEYINHNPQTANNPLASPILLTQEFVNNQSNDRRFPLSWPKTIIYAAQLDPLYDDCLVLMQRMVGSNIECECRVYKQLYHGFLSIGFLLSECKRTIQDSIQDLRKVIYDVDKIELKNRINRRKKITLSLLKVVQNKVDKDIVKK